MDDDALIDALQALLDQAEGGVLTAMAVFVRIGAMVAMLPGFGERVTPIFVRLSAALAFAIVIWPLTPEPTVPLRSTVDSFGAVVFAEALNGLLLGFSARLLVFALQTAGMLIGMSFSLSQMFGPGVAPDPEPAVATALTLAAIALAMNLGLHVEAAALMIASYDVLPFGAFPIGSDVAEWSVARVAGAFNFAVALSLPFILASFVYNLALGFINRAMPQMMVAFVGMPVITFAGLMGLVLLSGAMLSIWIERFEVVMADPLGSEI